MTAPVTHAGPPVGPPGPLGDAFVPHPAAVVEWARRAPDAVALRYRRDGGWREVARRDVVRLVSAATRSLGRLGLERGDRAAMFAATSAEWYVAALAVQSLGAIVMGIYPTSSVDQVARFLQHSGARFVFVGDATQLAAVREARARGVAVDRIVVFDPVAVDGSDDVVGWASVVDGRPPFGDALSELSELTAALDPDDVCTLVYTSGTTGEPKGAVHSFRTIAHVVTAVAPALGYGTGEEYLVHLPLSHTAEQSNTVVAGSTLGWTLSFGSVDTIADDLPGIRPTIMFAVPRVIEKVVERHRLGQGPDPAAGLRAAGLDRVRILLAGGAPLPTEVADRLAVCGLVVRNGYGMTEGGGITMPWEAPPRPDTVGTPLPGVEVRLAADGEVLVRSEGVCLGYYRDPDATQAMTDVDGFLRTGDLGEWTADGHLRLTGRSKDILITRGGKNISPTPIEEALLRSPVIRQAVVVGDGRPYLGALLVLADGTAGDALEDVQRHVDAVNATLSRPEQIKRFAVLAEPLRPETGELTTTMKLRRAAVAERHRDAIEGLYR